MDVVNFSAVREGAYAAISYPRCESFDIPVLGCLYPVRLHRQVSVRCPKGSVSTDLQCDFQVSNNIIIVIIVIIIIIIISGI